MATLCKTCGTHTNYHLVWCSQMQRLEEQLTKAEAASADIDKRLAKLEQKIGRRSKP